MRHADRAYDRVGQTEPYYGVITLERYLSANLNAVALREFFESGETQVASVLATIRTRFAADFKPRRALDFGCGVGRILSPLAREAGQAIGVDVSDAMMAEAARNCRERKLTNVSFVKSDDRLSRLEGTFDLIHSSIVFQHIVPRRVEMMVRGLLAHLEPGGVRRATLTATGVPQCNESFTGSRRRCRRSISRQTYTAAGPGTSA